jgi:Mrp family chromosome partitioning ATPase
MRLDVLAAKQASSAPYDLLASSRFNELLLEARREYDHVVVDCPPMVGVPESQVIERLVDGFLLVVCAHRTPRSLLVEALRVSDEGKILGLVFNEEDRLGLGYDRAYEYGDRSSSRNGRGHRSSS